MEASGKGFVGLLLWLVGCVVGGALLDDTPPKSNRPSTKRPQPHNILTYTYHYNTFWMRR